MKGYLTPCQCLLMSLQNLMVGHFRLLANRSPLVRPMVAVQALWGFAGPFETISSRFLLLKRILYSCRYLQTLVSNEEHEDRLLLSRCYPHRSSNLYTFLLLAKNFVSGFYKRRRQGNIPPPFFSFLNCADIVWWKTRTCWNPSWLVDNFY